MPGIFGRIFARFRKTPKQKKQVAQIKEDSAVIKFRTARGKNRATEQIAKRSLKTKGADHEVAKSYFERRIANSEKERAIAFENLLKRRKELKKAKKNVRTASRK